MNCQKTSVFVFAFACYVLSEYIWIMCYMLQAQSFLVDNDYPTPLSVWVNDLGLSEHDRRVLHGGEWLNADHISAAQLLLK